VKIQVIRYNLAWGRLCLINGESVYEKRRLLQTRLCKYSLFWKNSNIFTTNLLIPHHTLALCWSILYNLIWSEYCNMIGWSAWRKCWLYLIIWFGIFCDVTNIFIRQRQIQIVLDLIFRKYYFSQSEKYVKYEKIRWNITNPY
jgi:hypothetical protein